MVQLLLCKYSCNSHHACALQGGHSSAPDLSVLIHIITVYTSYSTLQDPGLEHDTYRNIVLLVHGTLGLPGQFLSNFLHPDSWRQTGSNFEPMKSEVHVTYVMFNLWHQWPRSMLPFWEGIVIWKSNGRGLCHSLWNVRKCYKKFDWRHSQWNTYQSCEMVLILSAVL